MPAASICGATILCSARAEMILCDENSLVMLYLISTASCINSCKVFSISAIFVLSLNNTFTATSTAFASECCGLGILSNPLCIKPKPPYKIALK